MPDATWDFEVFYDGDCPFCEREIAMLRKLDKEGRIRFTDIADPFFDPDVLGTTYETLMERIHGRLPDGTMIEGVEVFRQLYSAAGLPRLAAASRVWGLSHMLEAAYEVFADNRLRWAGRCVGDCGEGHPLGASHAAPSTIGARAMPSPS